VTTSRYNGRFRHALRCSSYYGSGGYYRMCELTLRQRYDYNGDD